MLDLKTAVVECLVGIVHDMRENMETQNRNASRETYNSLTIGVEKRDGTIVGTIKGSRVWKYIESGRKPGKVPKNFTRIISTWIAQKGIAVTPRPYKRPERGKGYTPEERGRMRLAAIIAYNIKKKGTKLYRQGGTKKIYTEPLDRRIEELRKAAGLAIVTEVKRINKEANENK